MKNPLVVFTGAALATLAALAGLNMTSWKPVPAPDQKAEQVVGTPPAEASQGSEATKAPEKPAETTQTDPAEPPGADTTEIQPTDPSESETEVKAGLDTVRVESDGQAVVAGRAEPGAEIALKLGDKVIGKGVANTDGSWVVVPDNPLPKGAHEIIVEQKSADSAPVTLEQSIAVAIPEKAGQQAMVALTEPGSATKVLQAGDSQEQQASAETAQPAAPEQPPHEVASADPAQPAPETTEPAAQAEQPAGGNETVAKTEEPVTTTEPAQTAEPTAKPVKVAENVPLRLDAVDYNDRGDIIFSGRGRPGTAVRLYVDNKDVGDAVVDSAGKWSFAGTDIIKPGTHTLRADQIDKSGKVMARIELPFQREDATVVAALKTPPAPEAVEPEQSQPSAAKPAAGAEAQSPQPTESQASEPAGTQATETRQPETQQPETQEAASEQPKTETPEPQPQVAETQKQTEVAKSEPEASGPPPEQPVAQDKQEEVTTAVVAAAEQAAKSTDPDQPRTGKVVIQPGNNLWKLSRVIYGRGKSYTVIYQANKDQIRNPSRIYPGQIFTIPNANPPEQIDPKRKDPLTSAEGGAPQ